MSLRLKLSEHDLLIRLLGRMDDAQIALILPEVADCPGILNTVQNLYDDLGDAWERETGECHPEHQPSDDLFAEVEAERNEMRRALFPTEEQITVAERAFWSNLDAASASGYQTLGVDPATGLLIYSGPSTEN